MCSVRKLQTMIFVYEIVTKHVLYDTNYAEYNVNAHVNPNPGGIWAKEANIFFILKFSVL
jgi:hypothetical protein